MRKTQSSKMYVKSVNTIRYDTIEEFNEWVFYL